MVLGQAFLLIATLPIFATTVLMVLAAMVLKHQTQIYLV